MEDIWETRTAEQPVNPTSEKLGFKARLAKLEEQAKYGKMKQETQEVEKDFKLPFKWKRTLNKSQGKSARDMVLVLYLNIKGDIEPPKLIPLYSGNVVIYKNKAYDFDPRAIWTLKVGKKMYKVLLIREMDRRPVSNLDWDEVKARGDSTDSDEILVKMVTKAVVDKIKKPMNKNAIIIIVILVILAIGAFFVFGK